MAPSKETVFSPLAPLNERRIPCPDDDLTAQAQYEGILEPNEYLEAYISAEEVQKAVAWAGQVISELVAADPENTVLFYIKEGGSWFWNAIQKLYPELQATGIKISTSDGPQTFRTKVNRHKFLWPGKSMIEGKKMIVLDDVGDRGYTQEVVSRLARRQGVREVITVNLIEKLGECIRKRHIPSYTGLFSGNYFLVGCGLDDGSPDKKRENFFRSQNAVYILRKREMNTPLPAKAA